TFWPIGFFHLVYLPPVYKYHGRVIWYRGGHVNGFRLGQQVDGALAGLWPFSGWPFIWRRCLPDRAFRPVVLIGQVAVYGPLAHPPGNAVEQIAYLGTFMGTAFVPQLFLPGIQFFHHRGLQYKK